MTEREKLKQDFDNFGGVIDSLQYVVNKELAADFAKLKMYLNNPNSSEEDLGGAVIEIGFRIQRVFEKLEDVQHVYRMFSEAAPEAIEYTKRKIQGK